MLVGYTHVHHFHIPMKPTCFTVQSEQSVPVASYKTNILFRLNSSLAIALLHMYAYVIINISINFGHELCCVIVFFGRLLEVGMTETFLSKDGTWHLKCLSSISHSF